MDVLEDVREALPELVAADVVREAEFGRVYTDRPKEDGAFALFGKVVRAGQLCVVIFDDADGARDEELPEQAATWCWRLLLLIAGIELAVFDSDETRQPDDYVPDMGYALDSGVEIRMHGGGDFAVTARGEVRQHLFEPLALDPDVVSVVLDDEGFSRCL